MSVADKMLKEIVTLAKKVARQEHETGGLWDKNQQLEDERDNLAAEIETLRQQLDAAKRDASDEFTERQVLTVEQQQDAAAWQQQLDAARAEIETLKGAMAADDRRLRDAEEKVWPGVTLGCDAADKMADEILHLRHLRNVAEDEAVVVRKWLNDETDRYNKTNAEKVDLFQKLELANKHCSELVKERDAARETILAQKRGIQYLRLLIDKVRGIVNREYDGREFEDIADALNDFDHGTLEPTPCPECERLRAFVGMVRELLATPLAQISYDDMSVVRAELAALDDEPTPVAKPEGGK